MPRNSENLKITQAERAERCLEVYKLMLKGLSRPEILQYCAKTWDVVERTADGYMATARAEIFERIEKDHDRSFALLHHRLEDLYKRAMKLQDYKTALAILKEHGALHDLYPSKRHEVTGADGGALNITIRYEDGSNG